MPAPKNLTPHAKEIFEDVMESLSDKNNFRTGRTYTGAEHSRIAWSAVKKKYRRVGNRWVAK